MNTKSQTTLISVATEIDTLLGSIGNDVYVDCPESIQDLLSHINRLNIALHSVAEKAETEDTHWADK